MRQGSSSLGGRGIPRKQRARTSKANSSTHNLRSDSRRQAEPRTPFQAAPSRPESCRRPPPPPLPPVWLREEEEEAEDRVTVSQRGTGRKKKMRMRLSSLSSRVLKPPYHPTSRALARGASRPHTAVTPGGPARSAGRAAREPGELGRRQGGRFPRHHHPLLGSDRLCGCEALAGRVASVI